MNKSIAGTKDGVDSLIDRARDAVVDVTEQAEMGVESVVGNVAEGAHAAGEYVRDGARAASRRAHRGLKDAAKSLDRTYYRVRGNLSRATTATADYTTNHPAKALLFAAGAGFLLCLCLRWRRLLN